MRGTEHLALGAGTVFVATWGPQFFTGHYDMTAIALPVAAAAAGSLVPDIDHPYSMISLAIPAAVISGSGVFLLMLWLETARPGFNFLQLSALPPVFRTAAWLAIGLGISLFALSITAGRIFGHRGPVHSITFGVAISAAILVALAVLHASPMLAAAFAWGWLTHLLGDASTKMGLPHLLWPFVQTRDSSRIGPV